MTIANDGSELTGRPAMGLRAVHPGRRKYYPIGIMASGLPDADFELETVAV